MDPTAKWSARHPNRKPHPTRPQSSDGLYLGVYQKKSLKSLSLFFFLVSFFFSSLLCIIQHLTSVSLSGSLPFFRLFLLFLLLLPLTFYCRPFLLPPPFPSLLMSSKAIRIDRLGASGSQMKS